jgi:nucleotide-binding universal stress UspA family protein
MFRDILVALDQTATAQRALQEAIELAEALNARLTLISIVPHIPSFAYRAGIDVGALEQEAEKESEKLLRESVSGLPEDLPVTTVLKHGHPGEEIVTQIEAGKHDLVVMGSRGLGRVTSNLFGTAGGYVHFHARVAMLVIHPEEESDA